MLEGHLPLTDKDLGMRSTSTKNPPLPNFASSNETDNDEKEIMVNNDDISDIIVIEICLKRKEGVIDIKYHASNTAVSYKPNPDNKEEIAQLRIVNRLNVNNETRFSLQYFDPYYWIKYCYDNAVAFPVVYFDILVREFVENESYRKYLLMELIELKSLCSESDMEKFIKFYDKVIEKALWFQEQEDKRVMITMK